MGARAGLGAIVILAVAVAVGLWPERMPAGPGARCGDHERIEVRAADARGPALLVCAEQLGSALERLGCGPAPPAPKLAAGRAIVLERCAARDGPMSAGASFVAGRPLELGEATAADLEALPGVGPALAARIVEARSRDGPFRDVAELRRVRGIGAGTLRRIEGWAVARSGAPR